MEPVLFIDLMFQICENYGPNLDTCPEGTVLGLLVDTNSCLHLYVNGMDQGVAAQDIPSPCYPFIDLYGQCEQVGTHTHTQKVSRGMKHKLQHQLKYKKIVLEILVVFVQASLMS